VSLSLKTVKRKHCQSVYQQFSPIYSKLRETLNHNFNATYYKRTRAILKKQLITLAKPHTNDPVKLITYKETLTKNMDKYFTCLMFPNIPADNNKAERALRHLVIKRKTSFGSKTDKGAQTTAILTSILLSLKWKDPKNFFHNYMKLNGENVA